MVTLSGWSGLENATDPRLELRRAEWLSDVVGCAFIEGAHNGVVVVDTGEKDNGKVDALGSPGLEHVNALETGHELVENCQIHPTGSSDFKRLRTVRCLDDLVTVCLEMPLYEKPNGCRIVGKENVSHDAMMAALDLECTTRCGRMDSPDVRGAPSSWSQC